MRKRKEMKETINEANVMFEEIKQDKNRADFYEVVLLKRKLI